MRTPGRRRRPSGARPPKRYRVSGQPLANKPTTPGQGSGRAAEPPLTRGGCPLTGAFLSQFPSPATVPRLWVVPRRGSASPVPAYAFLPRRGDSRPVPPPQGRGNRPVCVEPPRLEKRVRGPLRAVLRAVSVALGSPPFLPAPFPRWVKGGRRAGAAGLRAPTRCAGGSPGAGCGASAKPARSHYTAAVKGQDERPSRP